MRLIRESFWLWPGERLSRPACTPPPREVGLLAEDVGRSETTIRGVGVPGNGSRLARRRPRVTGGEWGQRRMPRGFGARGSELGPLAAAKGQGRAYLKAVLQRLLGPPGLSAFGDLCAAFLPLCACQREPAALPWDITARSELNLWRACRVPRGWPRPCRPRPPPRRCQRSRRRSSAPDTRGRSPASSSATSPRTASSSSRLATTRRR